jgi:hypothetical protein
MSESQDTFIAAITQGVLFINAGLSGRDDCVEYIGQHEEENRLGNAKAALKTFIQQLPDDGLGMTVFSSSATVLSPISPLGPKR